MKIPLSGLTAVTFLTLSCSSTAENARTTEILSFDSQLTGWEFYCEDPDVERIDVWNVEEGVLICRGNPKGYLYSQADLGDFTLELDWRWPADGEPGKGGVLFRMTGDHKVWPKSLEAQINAGDAGDFWGLDGYVLSGPAERLEHVDHETFGELTHLKKNVGAERPAGEWNHYEIRVEGETVTLKINGQLVNEATGCEVTPGKICLTAEGSEIHFRNIRLRS